MSRNSFWINSKWNLKTRHTSWILNFMIWFVIMPFVAIIGLVNYHNNYSEQIMNVNGFCMNMLDNQMIFGSVVSIFVAIGMAIEAYGWMNNISQVDMYKSVPVKESTRFAYINLNSFIIYAVGFLCNVIIEIAIFTFNGGFKAGDITEILTYVVINIVTFLSAYGIACIAVMLTGNAVLAAMGATFLNFVELFAIWLWETGKCAFYNGYEMINIKGIFSPINMALNAMEQGVNKVNVINDSPIYVIVNHLNTAGWLIIGVLQAVIYLTLTYQLYKRRPANVSGQRIVFKLARPVIEIAIGCIGGYAVALFMNEVGGKGTAIFSVAVFVIILHIVLKMIMDGKMFFDIRGVVTLAATFVIVTLLFSYQANDWGKYNTYIPDEENVEGYSIYVPSKTNLQYYQRGEDGTSDNMISDYILLDGVEITDKTTTKNMLQIINKALKDMPDETYGDDIKIKYYMKKGNDKYRTYSIKSEYVNEILAMTYDRMEYKEKYNTLEYNKSIMEDIINKEGSVAITNYTIYSDDDSYDIVRDNNSEDKEVYKRLYEAASKDILLRDGDTIAYDKPIGELDLTANYAASYGEYNAIDLYIPVYESDANTMAVLNELGW